jgi:hypothetical protein
MAYVHTCGQVHPEGAVTCEQARKAIAKRGREIQHEMDHHGRLVKAVRMSTIMF